MVCCGLMALGFWHPITSGLTLERLRNMPPTRIYQALRRIVQRPISPRKVGVNVPKQCGERRASRLPARLHKTGAGATSPCRPALIINEAITSLLALRATQSASRMCSLMTGRVRSNSISIHSK